jgi:Zn-dependent protease
MTRKGISIGSLFGIELRLDYSWFIIFALVSSSLIFQVLPTAFPDIGFNNTLFLGLAIALLLFFSVVVHELAHSLYAKRIGLKIDTITLFIFGGAAELHEEPKTPKDEFIMAAAGPLTSVVMAFIFAVLGTYGIQNNITPLVIIGATLSAINVILALFNLLPGLPLDGGRMLRSVIWRFSNDYLRSTKIASIMGQILGYSVALYGIFQAIYTVSPNGIWLVLIGLFLKYSARLTYDQTLHRFLLKDVTVADIMILTPSTMSSNTKSIDRRQTTSHESPQSMFFDTTVSSLNEMHIPVLDPNDSAITAFDEMALSKHSVLPVAEDGKIIGILKMTALVHLLSRKHNNIPA